MKKLMTILAVLFLTAVSACAADDLKIYCGLSVPRSDFDYPDSSEREYGMREYDALFAGNSKERYFKSQIFIDEIFVRYGYDFRERKRAPGKVIYDKYIQADWYAEAIRACPTQDQLTLMNRYMSGVERRNIENVNIWQQMSGITPFDNPDEVSCTVSPITRQTADASPGDPEQTEEASPEGAEQTEADGEDAAPEEIFVKQIRPGRDFEAKDFSGAGSSGTIRVTENEGGQRLSFGGSDVDLPGGAKIWFFHYDKENTFLVIDSGEESSPGWAGFLASDGDGNLSDASGETGAYPDVHISRIDKDGIIHFSTGYCDAEETLSFRHCAGPMFRVTEKYYVNTERRRVFRRSSYGEFGNNVYMKYISPEPVVLSTSAKEYDAEGPVLPPGQEVRFTRVYFEPGDSDGAEWNYVYELETEGGTGWFREAENLQFSDDPEAEVLKAETGPLPAEPESVNEAAESVNEAVESANEAVESVNEAAESANETAESVTEDAAGETAGEGAGNHAASSDRRREASVSDDDPAAEADAGGAGREEALTADHTGQEGRRADRRREESVKGGET